MILCKRCGTELTGEAYKATISIEDINGDSDFALCKPCVWSLARFMDTTIEALRADLQHLRDQAGPDSCADQLIRRETAERQLAEARALIEGLQEEIGDWKDATMLLVGGDPDGVTPKHLNRELLDLRRAVRLAFDEVTEADGWRTEWWAEEWVPMAEDLLSDNPARRAPATEEPTDGE